MCDLVSLFGQQVTRVMLCTCVFCSATSCYQQELCERAGKPMPPTPYKSLQQTRFKNFQGTCPCHVLHPGQTCNGFMLNFFPEAYVRSVLLTKHLFQTFACLPEQLLSHAPCKGHALVLGCLSSSMLHTACCYAEVVLQGMQVFKPTNNWLYSRPACMHTNDGTRRLTFGDKPNTQYLTGRT